MGASARLRGSAATSDLFTQAAFIDTNMIKRLIVICLLAVSPVAVFAASSKTSHAIPLSDSQMAVVKGQASMFVFAWNASNSTYSLVYQANIGYTGYQFQFVYSLGPRNGVSYIGQVDPSRPADNGQLYTNGDFDSSGNFRIGL